MARALEDADGVVNLVGVLAEGGNQTFQVLHADAAAAVAEAAKVKGISKFVQFSAIGAAEKGARYARSKFEGEQRVREALPSATILRPSIIFGPEDSFFNRFANMAKFAPLMVYTGGKSKFQPVFVGDVADAVVKALNSDGARGKTYELGGPRTYSFKQLMQFVLNEIDRPRPLIDLPFFIAHPLGMLLSGLFKAIPFADAPLTGDQVLMLRTDNVVSPGALTISDLGVATLESVEAVVPSYLALPPLRPIPDQATPGVSA